MFFLILLFLVFLFGSGFVIAVERPLEVEYPEIGEWTPTIVRETDLLPRYVQYVFKIAIVIAGLVAFAALIYGGIRYLTSAGSPTALTDAKERITAGILGLVLLLSSYLILTTINPQLTFLTIEKEPPGLFVWKGGYVYLYVEGRKEPYKFALSIPKLSFYFDPEKIEKIKVENPLESVPDPKDPEGKKMIVKPIGKYALGAILHTDNWYKGGCRIFSPDLNKEDEEWPESELSKVHPYLGTILAPKIGTILAPTTELLPKASSLTLFYRVPNEMYYGEVKLCPEVDLEGDCETYKEGRVDATNLPVRLVSDRLHIDEGVWSMEITGNYLVVLFDAEVPFTKGNFPTRCQVFRGPVTHKNLEKAPINKCAPYTVSWGYRRYHSCAKSVAIFPYLPVDMSIEDLEKRVGMETKEEAQEIAEWRNVRTFYSGVDLVEGKHRISFDVPSDRWRVKWTAPPTTSFLISVYREQPLRLCGTLSSLISPGSGEIEIDPDICGKGGYYFNIEELRGKLTIEIKAFY